MKNAANDAKSGQEVAANPLVRHHRDLDCRLERLLARARGGDLQQLRAEWTSCERELLRHLELEEAEILPAFAHHDAAAARAILAEHAAIRGRLLDLGLNLDLHCLRVEAIEELVRELRAHAQREDAALYDWADRNLPVGTWGAIRRALGETARRAGRVVRLRGRLI